MDASEIECVEKGPREELYPDRQKLQVIQKVHLVELVEVGPAVQVDVDSFLWPA